MHGIFYHRPRLEHANNLVSLIFWKIFGSDIFGNLRVTFANSLYPDQDRQNIYRTPSDVKTYRKNVQPDLDPSC